MALTEPATGGFPSGWQPNTKGGMLVRPPVAGDFRMALLELIRQYRDDIQVDALREGVRLLAEAFMEAEVREQTGAGRYERTPERKTYRNGYRERLWTPG